MKKFALLLFILKSSRWAEKFATINIHAFRGEKQDKLKEIESTEIENPSRRSDDKEWLKLNSIKEFSHASIFLCTKKQSNQIDFL